MSGNIPENDTSSPCGDLEEREAESALAGLRDLKQGDFVCTVCNRFWDVGPMGNWTGPYFTCTCGALWKYVWCNYYYSTRSNEEFVWHQEWRIVVSSQISRKCARIPPKNT